MIFLILIISLVICVVYIKLSLVTKRNRTLHSYVNLDKLLQKRYKPLKVLLDLAKTSDSETQKAEYSERLVSEILSLGTNFQNIDRRIAYERELVKNVEQIISVMRQTIQNNEFQTVIDEYNNLSVQIKDAVAKYNADAHILRIAVDTFPSSFIARLSKIKYFDNI